MLRWYVAPHLRNYFNDRHFGDFFFEWKCVLFVVCALRHVISNSAVKSVHRPTKKNRVGKLKMSSYLKFVNNDLSLRFIHPGRFTIFQYPTRISMSTRDSYNYHIQSSCIRDFIYAHLDPSKSHSTMNRNNTGLIWLYH